MRKKSNPKEKALWKQNDEFLHMTWPTNAVARGDCPDFGKGSQIPTGPE